MEIWVADDVSITAMETCRQYNPDKCAGGKSVNSELYT